MQNEKAHCSDCFSDDTVHSNDIHFSEDIVTEMIIRNTEAIKPLFSEANMKIFPVLGNHDAFPKSQFPSNHSADDLYEQVADVWKDFLQPVDAYDSFKTKGKDSEKILKQS